MTRKNRTDSTQQAVKAFAAATLAIEPPIHCALHSGAEPFYNAIIASRAAEMWNDVDLARAVLLANYQADLKRETAELQDEGSVIVNERGTPIMNPRFNIVNTLTRLEISLSKALQTDAASTQGVTREVVNKNKQANDARRAAAGADPLIPMMQVVK